MEALSANAMLGGDSAARGLMLGLLMGARHGADAFSAGWTDQLKAIGTINHALERLEEPQTERRGLVVSPSENSNKLAF